MVSFKDLKKNRAQQADKIRETMAAKTKGGGFKKDERYWDVTRDKTGTGFAVIRFLPAQDVEESFVTLFRHSFKGPTGKWYIENSRTTIGEQDPVSDYNKTLWESGIEANKKLVSERYKRQTKYIANILVVKDPANPENEGKVFLWKYGKQIQKMIDDLMNPEFEDEKSMNPFDMWDGVDFKLKVRVVDDFPKYDKSEFDKASAGPITVNGTKYNDAKLEEVWNSTYLLAEEIAEKHFKPFDELKRLHAAALGLGDGGSNGLSRVSQEASYEADVEEEAPARSRRPEGSGGKRRTTADTDGDQTAEFLASLED